MKRSKVPQQVICLGPVPPDEDCEQVGVPGYDPGRAANEAAQWKRALARLFPPPEGARLAVATPEFGGREVVAVFPRGNTAALEWALRCEGECPTHWSPEDIRELEVRGYHFREKDLN